MTAVPQWGYDDSNGPAKWAEYAADARGSKQSPIVIKLSDVVFDQKLQDNALKFHYQDMETCNVINTGRSVQLDAPDGKCYIECGPMGCKYELKQFHFHWGKTDSVGAEHIIGDKVYASELHLVHWNCEKYTKFEDAVKAPDGLCVLGVFIEPGKQHDGMMPLTQLMSNITYACEQQPLSAKFNPKCLLPAETDKYWTYGGSLTTPPCFESVTFVLFKQPIQFSTEQLKAFRDLRYCCRDSGNDPNCCHLVNNFRPPMPLNGRTVRASFR